jgi:hypothetical protein
MPFFGELILAQAFKQRAKPLVMRPHLAVPVEHFVEEIIVLVFSQHQSKSHILSKMLNWEPIKAVSGGEGKTKKVAPPGRLGLDHCGTSR